MVIVLGFGASLFCLYISYKTDPRSILMTKKPFFLLLNLSEASSGLIVICKKPFTMAKNQYLIISKGERKREGEDLIVLIIRFYLMLTWLN